MLKRNIPNEVRRYLAAVDERARASGIDKLRDRLLPDNDIEVRIWVGFGLAPMEGFVFHNRNGAWHAAYLPPLYPPGHRLSRKRIEFLRMPRSGWRKFWEDVVKDGLLTLPDLIGLSDRTGMVKDGTGYVVEINRKATYRAYHYAHPWHESYPEAKKMIRIIQRIYDDFGIRSVHDDRINRHGFMP